MCAWLTSALISAVQQIAKGKMFSSAIVVMMVGLTCVQASTNLFTSETIPSCARSPDGNSTEARHTRIEQPFVTFICFGASSNRQT